MQPPHVVGAIRMSAVSTISPFMIEPSLIARHCVLVRQRAGPCDFRHRRGTYRVLDDRGLQSRDQSSPLMLGGVALACRRSVVRLGTVPPPSLVIIRRLRRLAMAVPVAPLLMRVRHRERAVYDLGGISSRIQVPRPRPPTMASSCSQTRGLGKRNGRRCRLSGL